MSRSQVVLSVKFKFHGIIFREDVGVSGDIPVPLATRLPDWSAGGLLRCSAACLSVCRVVLLISQARHARLVAHILARMSHGCYEETDFVEFQFYVGERSNSISSICCGFVVLYNPQQLKRNRTSGV